MYKVRADEVSNINNLRNKRFLQLDNKGGFISSTVSGCNTRSEDSLYLISLNAPVNRYKVVHKVEEKVIIGEKEYDLTSQRYVDVTKNRHGYNHFVSYKQDVESVFSYLVEGSIIRKRVLLSSQDLSVYIKYEIDSVEDIKLLVDFQISGHNVGTYKAEESYDYVLEESNDSIKYNSKTEVDFKIISDCDFTRTVEKFTGDYFLEDDSRDGRDSICSSMSYGYYLNNNKEQNFVITTNENKFNSYEEALKAEELKVNEIYNNVEIKDDFHKKLVKASDGFICERENTNSKTIVAGYPFFGDWGRDTFIAFNGACLVTKRYEVAKDILRTFTKFEEKGLLPNVFSLEGEEPEYNTVDAPLLFIKSVYEYFEKTNDLDFVENEMFKTMSNIVNSYIEGTDFDIFMDEDHLISAGNIDIQLTWMDIKINGILPTPRNGKAVEINGLWYNALKIMQTFNGLFNKVEEEKYFENLASKVKTSFNHTFVKNGIDYLLDVEDDYQLRPNQCFVFDLNFKVVDEDVTKKALSVVLKNLYTHVGMRTLEVEDLEFKEEIVGNQFKRDMAYHQGTVWTFVAGSFLSSYLEYFPERKEFINEILSYYEDNLEEYCIGYLAEIFDGLNPKQSRGCYAQAWSVCEILRVKDKLNV